MFFKKKPTKIIENTRKIGQEAEDFMVQYLEKNGYTILDQNFFIRGGELDIIAAKKNLVIFVEVRSWNRSFWENGSPLETINQSKVRHIIKTALFYIQKKKIDLDKTTIRFDVAALIKKQNSYDIQYVESAFTMDDYR